MAIFTRKPKPTPPMVSADADRIFQIGIEMLDSARRHKLGLLSAKFYQDKLMDWSMKDHEFKVQLFRFVDAFPTLSTPDIVHEHLVDYLTQPGVKLPPFLSAALKAGGVAKGAMTKTISSQIKSMAENFIAGVDAHDALPDLARRWSEGIAFSVDLLGEACVSDAEADVYRDKYMDLVTNLPKAVASWKANPRLETDHIGVVPRTNVSIKISSLSAKCDPIDTEGAIDDLMPRLRPILEAAKINGVLINFDIEQFELKDLTFELFERCCEEVDFEAGLAMQSYLRSGSDDARRIAAWATRAGRRVTVRLVKGAYWDYETIHAEEMGWPNPVWSEKWRTDACFEEMTDILLDAMPRSDAQGGVTLALGSHNVRSIAYALAGLEARDLPTNAVELQMLHGMADQLKLAAAGMGLRVREYVPVGDMIPGMAYLVRRLLENTSNESWLKAGFLDDADPKDLLAEPAPHHTGTSDTPEAPDLYQVAAERHQLSPAHPDVGDGKAFVNEPVRDFADRAQRDAYARAIERAVVPTGERLLGADEAMAMLTAAHAAFPRWRDTDQKERSACLVRAGAAMRARRDELCGVMIKEAGKTWREADADLCEAIDFCEYYARMAMPMFARRRLGKFIGELDEVWYQPKGVAVVISPWNFPAAIFCGMTTAALVTGNCAIVKPSRQTVGIAKIITQILWDAGVPRDVLHFCHAPGATVGSVLVRDPRVAMIAFTGSKPVGLDIIEGAARNPLSACSPAGHQRAQSVSDGAFSDLEAQSVSDGSSSPARPSGEVAESSRSEGVSTEDSSSPSLSPRERVPAQRAGEGSSSAPFPQLHVKKIIAEMGGKNAIIIDTSADIDEAVLGVRYSAFGFQGQKCSACSRCIVVDPDGPDGKPTQTFLKRLVESTRSLVIDDPRKPGADLGPVIDASAKKSILDSIEAGKRECTLELAMETPDGLEAATGRDYVPPHIFSRVTMEHTIGREEIFGPVLSVMHAKTFAEALNIANASEFKLTGGVFTRMPAHIEQAKRDFRVGNLYINQGCTGAVVARQPFGGAGMSGVGTKAGGADYLLHFTDPRACCENTMRRGFAPEL